MNQADLEVHNTAFNRGCDARLAGLPMTLNPYFRGGMLWQAWRRGYDHVSQFWGSCNRHARPLPALRELG